MASFSSSSSSCCSKKLAQKMSHKLPPKSLKKVSKSCNAHTTRRPRTSPIWAYATQNPNERITLNKDGQEVWICSLCTTKNTSYLLSGGTAAPIRHLLRVHSIQIPPSTSKNKKRARAASVSESIANSISKSMTNTNPVTNNKPTDNSTTITKQLLPSPAIQSPSSSPNPLTKSLSSLSSSNSNTTNLATLNLDDITIDNNPTSALFDVLLKYDVPASAIPTSKFRAFCSMVNPDAVLAINSSSSPLQKSSPVSLTSSVSSSPSLSSHDLSIQSQYLVDQDSMDHDKISPITPSSSSNTLLSTPELSSMSDDQISAAINILSNPTPVAGWYYPGLDSPLTPITPSTNSDLDDSLFTPMTPVDLLNLSYGASSLAYNSPSDSFSQLNQFAEPSSLFTEKLVYPTNNLYDLNFYTAAEW